MNKIALLTFHDTTNFGALLQTYGLYKKLNDMGKDCNILDYKCTNIIKREVPSRFKLTLDPKVIAIEALVTSKSRRRYASMQQFMKKHMSKISQSYNRSTVFNIKEEFDTYVVGSDMCWGLDITDGDFSYFLDFVPDNKRKFSYATSIGKREWTAEEMRKISGLLSRFNTVSVREEATVERLKPVLAKDCHVVCDPTMLLTAEEWMPYVSQRYKQGGFVLVYFNTDDGKTLSDAKEYANEQGKKLIVISSTPSFITKTHNVYPAKVEDFLSLIYYADTVFTASYHGLLFSLYFHKNIVYYNRQPTYRMQTVAKRMGIENREGRSVDLKKLSKLDYDIIDNKLSEYRAESINYINNALEY